MRRELLFSLMITLMLVPIFASAGSMQAMASGSPPGPKMSVEPSEIIDTTMVPGSSEFSINVTIANVTGLEACDFNLTYDSNVITFITIGFLRVNGQFPLLALQSDDVSGFLWANFTYLNPVTVIDPTAIVTITFLLKNLGSTPLNLNDTNMMDSQGGLIPHDTYNGFFSAVIRDIAVTGITLSATGAYAGWPVNVTVDVENNGNLSETFNLTAFFDSNTIGVISVTGLVPNEQRSIVFTWNTTGVPEGNYTISAYATPVPYETHVSDNTLIDGTVWVMTKKHDVAITAVAVPRTWVYQGWTVPINVTAQNLGEFSESFDVNAYYDGTILFGTAHVSNLAPLENFTAQFNLNTSSLQPCSTYTISAQATPVPYEYNMTNNVLVGGDLTVRLMGDLNGDGRVNLIDYFEVTLAFGSYPGSPRWDPAADVNNDLKINLQDVFIVSLNFGKTCA